MAKSQGRYWQIQENFLNAFVANGCTNATQALIKAKYSPKGANSKAAQLLATVSIKARLAAKLKPKLEKYEADGDRVIEELAALAFTPLDECMDYGPDRAEIREPKDMTPRARQAVKSVKIRKRTRTEKGKDGATITTVETELSMHSKSRALHDLAQITKLLKDDTDLDTTRQPLNIVITVHPDCAKRVAAVVY